MSDFQPEYSRSAARGRKRKQNRLLNLLIAIVCILILIVGYSIFFTGGGSQKADQSSQSAQNGQHHNGGDNGSGGAAGTGSHKDKKDKKTTFSFKSSKDQNSGGSDSQTTNGDQKDNKKAKSGDQKNKDKKNEASGNLNGPWEPIGTKQEPPHQKSYHKGSVDWNEQVQALLYATGIHKGDYILWWLGNGGTPQTSVGKISSKENPNEMYVVNLKWVKGKGWKPTSVKKVQK
ncbi:MAG TPA: DUF1510 family protein [Bacillales bacterium]|nr:DUF1510 family protein [Bacillales bacterium]